MRLFAYLCRKEMKRTSIEIGEVSLKSGTDNPDQVLILGEPIRFEK